MGLDLSAQSVVATIIFPGFLEVNLSLAGQQTKELTLSGLI